MSSSGKRVRTTVARQRSALLRGLSASLAVTMMAGAALLAASVGTATVAHADSAPPSTLTCNTSTNRTTYQTTWNDTNTFTLSPASVSVGHTITATWTSADGLINGSPTTLANGSTQFQAVIALSGAMSGDVVATTTPDSYPNGSYYDDSVDPAVTGIESGYPLGAINATTTFTAAGAGGTLTATVLETIFNATTLDTYCSPFVGSQVSAGPPATYVGNYPATTDPAPTYLAGYTPDIQSPATPTGHPGQNSFGDILIGANDTSVATASNTIDAASASPSDSASASASASASVSASASASASSSPINSTTPPASLNCNTGNNGPAFATTYTDTMAYTLSPASPAAGETVTATYTGATGIGNAAPVTLYQGTVQVQAVIALSGAMSGTVVAVTTPGTYPAADIPSTDTPTPTGPYSASTTFTASGSGTVNATVSELVLKGGLDTYCSPATGNYPGSSASTIASTMLKGYTPNWQTNSASITYNNGQNSCTATAIAVKTLSVSGGTEATVTAAPSCMAPTTSSTPTTSDTTSPTTSTSAPASGSSLPSTVTKQVSGVYCQIFTSQNGILWNGPADPQNPASKSVAAPFFTVAMTPQKPTAGQKVTITVKYNVGNGAGPSDIPANADKLRGVVQLSGSLTNQVIVSSSTLPAFPGSSTNPNSRVPSLPMTGTFTFPSTANAVVYASLLTTADDDGNPANIGNTNGDPQKPDTFNWPKVSDLFDVVCNKSLTAKLHPLTPTSGLTAAVAFAQPQAVAPGTDPAGAIGVTAGVPYYGTVAAPPTTTESASTAPVVSGDTLPHTGASGVVGAGVVAAIVIQLGMILYVRSVRAVPVRRPSHA